MLFWPIAEEIREEMKNESKRREKYVAEAVDTLVCLVRVCLFTAATPLWSCQPPSPAACHLEQCALSAQPGFVCTRKL